MTTELLSNGTGLPLEEHCKRAWNFWRTTLKSPRTVMAPMVDQSELPYRMLGREHGAGLCYSPMIHSRLYAERDEVGRARMFETSPEDRPLVVQFCGNDPQTLLAAARAVEDKCDAVDLNLGCPQGIARKGRYGAYLLEEQDVVLEIVRTLSAGLKVPLTVKIRLLPDPNREATLVYAQQIVAAGASVLTVHGRNKEEKKHLVGSPDWAMIGRIRAAVGIPVIANGGISTPEDVAACLNATGCAAVMTSEMSLATPYVFQPVGSNRPSIDAVVKRYLDLVDDVGPLLHAAHKPVRAHLFKLLYPALLKHVDIRDALVQTSDLAAMRKATEELASRGWEEELHAHGEDAWLTGSWYYRHREGHVMLVERQNENGAQADGEPAVGSGGGTNSNGSGGGRSLAFCQEQLRATLLEAATSAELYQKILDEGGNKKERNQLKRRVATAEKRKLKLMRKVANMEQGISEGGDGVGEDGADEDNEKDVGEAEVNGNNDGNADETKAKRPRVDNGVAP